MLAVFLHYFLLGQNRSQIKTKSTDYWLHPNLHLHHPWSNQLSPCFSGFLSPQNSTHSHWYSVPAYIHLLTHSLLIFSQIISFILPSLLYHPLHYLLITWNLFVTMVIQRGTARPITPLIESDQKPIESRSNICISPSSVWFNCQCCQSRLCCCLPEPCHSSLPRNVVSRFTV